MQQESELRHSSFRYTDSTKAKNKDTHEEHRRRRRSMADVCRVAVVGAGPAGLVVCHRLTSGTATRRYEVTVFEQSDRVGGLWVYTDRTGVDDDGRPVHSAMYENLRTNLPKETMAFLDFPFAKGGPSYCSRQEVLTYLDEYCNTYDTRKHIRFSVRVTKILPIHKSNGDEPSWRVETSDVQTGRQSVHEFDAIAVCNGHYVVPNYPELPGLGSMSTVMHSHDYRVPEPFAKKTVVCLGAGTSGLDIACDLAAVAARIFLCSKNESPFRIPDAIQQMPWPVSCDTNRVAFADGRFIENVDAVIVCTGYKYSIPFMAEDGRLTRIVDGGKRVTPLYKHLFHVRHPSLAFFGLPKGVLPFPLTDVQAQVFKKTLEGTVRLPSVEDMEAEEARRVQATLDRGSPPRHFHVMTPDTKRAYVEDLEEFGSVDERMPHAVHELFKAAVRNIRHLGLDRFRNIDFGIAGDEFYERNRDGSKKNKI